MCNHAKRREANGGFLPRPPVLAWCAATHTFRPCGAGLEGTRKCCALPSNNAAAPRDGGRRAAGAAAAGTERVLGAANVTAADRHDRSALIYRAASQSCRAA